MSQIIECPEDERPDNCPRRRATDWGVWVRWGLFILASVALVAGGGAFRNTVEIEHRTTRNESDITALQDADKLIRAERAVDRDEYRRDIQEIKADIKKLLERGR